MSRLLDNNKKKKIEKAAKAATECRGQRGEAPVLAAHIRKANAAAALSRPGSVYAAFCCGILVAARNRYPVNVKPQTQVCLMECRRRDEDVVSSLKYSLTPVVQIHHLFYSKICSFTPL